MLFGLTNSLSTFQALINEVFKQLLRKFVLFFNDILIYIKDWDTHMEHLRIVFNIPKANELRVKLENADSGIKKYCILDILF